MKSKRDYGYMKKASRIFLVLLTAVTLYCVSESVDATEDVIEEPLRVTTLSRKYEKAKFLNFANKKNSGDSTDEVIEIDDYTDENENIVIEDTSDFEENKSIIDFDKAQELVSKLLNTCALGMQRVIEAPEKEARLAEELAKSREQVLKNWEAKKAEEALRAQAEAEAARIALEKENEILVEAPTDGENIVIKDGVPTDYVKVMNVTATAYCICQKCCGKSPNSPGYGVTASGLRIIPGTGMKVIAVDPKVVKLGTHVYVEGLNGAPDYGYAIAADTGGAIKNMKIDLYFDSHADTIKWGRRKVNLYILPD